MATAPIELAIEIIARLSAKLSEGVWPETIRGGSSVDRRIVTS
jgi:hypothetical protein